MIRVNKGTKVAESIIRTFNSGWSRGRTIYEAYSNPSSIKVQAYNNILSRALNTPGYNRDIRVTGASSYVFSTMYSVTDENGTHIIYDTPSYTKVVTV